MFQYLAHGSLLQVILIHAAINLVALLVRPATSDWLARRQAVRTVVEV